MAGSNDVTIKVTDGIQPSILTTLQNIGKTALTTDSAIQQLQASLNSIKTNSFTDIQKAATTARTSVTGLTSAIKDYTASTLQNALAQERLNQAQARTATAQATSATKTAAVQMQEAAKTAQVQAQAIAQAAATEAQAQAKIQAAQDAVAASAQKLQQELARTAQAQSKATAEATKAATAERALETAQERLSAATAKTDEAFSKAELAQLRLEQAQKRASSSSNSLSSALSGVYNRLILLTGGAIAIGELSTSFVKLSDSYQLMQNRLQNVATSQGQVNTLMKELQQVADETRSPIDDTVNAFQRFDRALREQGASQEESIRFTKTLNELLMMSGDTTQEATAATIQLSQAFNAGKLQGNDFHSVATELPAALDAIAKTMGVSVAQLKTLSSQGKITSEIMRQAFASIATQTDDLAAKHLPTVEQSFVVLKNNVTTAIGAFNQSTGVTRALSNGILGLADNLDLANAAVKTLGVTMLAVLGAAVLTNMAANVARVQTAIDALKESEIALAAVRIATNPFAAITVGIIAAGTALYEFSDKIKPLGDNLTTISDMGKIVFGDLADYATKAWDIIEKGWEKVKGFIETVANMMPSMPDMGGGFNRMSIPLADNGSYLRDVEQRAQAQALVNQFNKENPDLLGLNKLRPAGPNTSGSNVDPNAGKRADDLAKINLQLDNEISRLNMLKPAREIQQKYDQIEQELASKHITLNKQESDSLKEKLTIIQNGTEIQSKMDSAYEAATGPLRDYSNTTKALNILLKQGAISQTEYSRQVAVADETYKSASDHLYAVNKDLDDQIDLMRSVGDEQSVNQQLQQITNQLTAAYGDKAKDEAEKLRTKVQLLQDLSRYQSQYNTIYSNTVGLQKDGIAQIQAANDAQSKGLISSDVADVNRIQGEGSISQGRLNSGNYSASDVLKATVAKTTSDYTNLASGFSDSMGSFFDSFSNSFGDTVQKVSTGSQTIKSALKSIASDAIGSLISSLARLAAQYLIVQSVTGIASLFGGSLFGSTGSLASSVSGSGWASSSAFGGLTGFADGGFTGAGGRNEVAGTVHRGEYVVDANTTAKVGIAALDGLKNMNTTTTKSGPTVSQTGITINMGGININNPNVTDGKTDQSTMSKLGDQINDMVTNRVRQIMTNEQRPGGTLYRGA